MKCIILPHNPLLVLSWSIPKQTSDVNGIGVLRMLEAIREYEQETERKVKFYQASTSEMFGQMVENPSKETTPFILVLRTVWQNSMLIGW